MTDTNQQNPFPPGTAPVDDVPGAFAEWLRTAVADRPGPRCTLFLSGGALAADCYQRVAAIRHGRGSIDWADVDVYLGDERMVPPDDPDANQRLVRQALMAAEEGEPGSGVGSFTPMPTHGDAARCAAAYQSVLSEVLRGPGIDLVHLGLGPDGHTASLFPDSAALDAPEGTWVLPNRDPHGRNPHERLTLTLPALNRARRVVFTVRGAEKAPAVAALRRGEDLPAARVVGPEITWLIDPAAWGDGADAGPAGA